MKTVAVLMVTMLTLIGFAYGDGTNVSSQIGYTIQYPDNGGWTAGIAYHKDNVETETIMEHAVLYNNDGACITVDVWKSHPKLDLKYWLALMENRLKLEKTFAEEIRTSVENLPAMRYTFLADNVQAFNSQMTFFKNSDKVFRVGYLEKDLGRANEVYRQMVQTFSFAAVGQEMGPLSKEKGGSRVYSCGGQNDDCKCNMDNPYPCCDNGGNCTWWAWESACCNWGIGLPSPWRHAKYWATDLASHGYHVSQSPSAGTIACRDTGTYGHVAWVLQVSGSQVKVSEMNCCDGCNSGVREHWYEASYFSGGFISR